MADIQGTSSVGLPRHPFHSVREAATELRQAAASASADPLHPLPFNRYAPEDTEWWLSPVSDNPAYKHAKIALAASPNADPGDLFVGLSFEKGVGQTAAEFFDLTARGRRRVADRTWAWERKLIPALRSGEFREAAAAAQATAGVPLTVFMAAIYMQPSRGWDDQGDVRAMGWPSDVVRLEYSGESLTLIDESITADLLSSAVSARSFADVAAALDGMPKADWAWVDFAIGIRMSQAVRPDPTDWSAADIWRRVCEPWAGWID
jgi:hypothetical protein